MRLRRYAFSLGFLSSAFQVIFLRRMYSSFAGSELAVGVGFFGWMLFYGLGGIILGRFADRTPEPERYFPYISFCVFIVCLLSLTFSYYLRDILNYEKGEIINPYHSLPAVFLFAFLPCVFMGFLFALVPLTARSSDSIAYAYSLESLGGASGAIFTTLTSLFSITPFNEFLLAGGFLLLILFEKLLIIPGLICIFAPLFFDAEKLLITGQGFYGRVIVNKSTPYSHLVLGESNNQLTLFVNELPLTTIGERGGVEGKVLMALYFSGDGNALFIGPDLTLPCLFYEGYKGSVKVLWNDRGIFDIQKNFLKGCSENRENFQILVKDPILYLREDNEKFNLIFFTPGEPASLGGTRFFTEEFFTLLKRRLDPSGVFFIKAGEVTSSLGNAQARVMANIYITLQKVWSRTIVLPLDEFIFISTEANIPLPSPQDLRKFMDERNLHFTYGAPENIGYLISPDRVNYYLGNLKVLHEVSTTFKNPRLYILTAMKNSEISRPGDFKILRFVEKNYKFLIAFFMLIGTLICFSPLFKGFIKRENFRELIPSWVSFSSVFTSGFLSMSFLTLFLTLFQEHVGSLFMKISLFNFVYYIALFAGPLVYKGKTKDFLFLFLLLLIFLSGSGIITAYLFLKNEIILHEVFFYFLLFITGFLSSLIFRTSAQCEKIATGKWAGTLDFADHTGASLGAFLISLLLLPFSGIISSLIVILLFSLFFCFIAYYLFKAQRNG